MLRTRPTLKRIGKERLSMTIPIALKPFLRIILLFQLEKVNKLRITSCNLTARGPTMIAEVVSARVPDGWVDDSEKILSCRLQTFVGVDGVQIANRAYRRLAGPC